MYFEENYTLCTIYYSEKYKYCFVLFWRNTVVLLIHTSAIIDKRHNQFAVSDQSFTTLTHAEKWRTFLIFTKARMNSKLTKEETVRIFKRSLYLILNTSSTILPPVFGSATPVFNGKYFLFDPKIPTLTRSVLSKYIRYTDDLLQKVWYRYT